MVPVVALPPVTPLTCHVTAVLVVPVTNAVNWAVPLRRVAAGPDTVTAICGPEGVDAPEQPLIDVSVTVDAMKAKNNSNVRVGATKNFIPASTPSRTATPGSIQTKGVRLKVNLIPKVSCDFVKLY
jgi:hypothetical protein